jgi:hypothetical protein
MAKRTTEDLKAYWQELADKAGLDPQVVANMNAALGDEAVARTFRQAFVPVPDHHSQLDQIRAEADATKTRYEDWYANTALPAYQTNLNGIDRLHQYEAVYGELSPGEATRSDANALGFKSKAELDKYLDDRLRAERAGTVSLMKSIPKMSVDYLHRFGEVLDTDEIEKISIRDSLPPDLAYERYIAPRVETQRQKDFDAKLKEAREQGAREAMTKNHIPIDSTPRESSPFFDRDAPTPPPANEFEADRASRAAFMDGWVNYKDALVNKNRS